MPRKLRLQYEGAVYHVISRGNYRAHVFADDTTKVAFLKCLDEACGKAGWVVHGWCVMSNHYHLCVETPQPNLIEGMRWLQSTFAIRFNRLRDERGHLFQGRYNALVVAPEAVGAVCHYIHLNPVRARLVASATLGAWPWTSVRQIVSPRARPPWLSVESALTDAGGLADTPGGRRAYIQYLGWLHEDDDGKRALEFERMSNDWAIGTRGFKKQLLQAHADLRSKARNAPGVREMALELCAERLQGYLRALGKTPVDGGREPKGAPWKVAIAEAMKRTTTASNPWLAGQLNMGSPFRLSRLVTECRENPAAFSRYTRRIAKCKV
jgi:REP element-mobilizing transposase RayT